MRSEHSVASTLSLYLSIYVVLYDLLLDDDEDVRNIGAKVVSWIFSQPAFSPEPVSIGNKSLCAVAAAQTLLQFIKTAYDRSKELLYEAISRLTSGPTRPTHNGNIVEAAFIPQEDSKFFISPPAGLFDEARKEDNSLFAIEKHNLYIDPSQESQRWADVLVHISPAILDESITTTLVRWVLTGLEYLVNVSDHELGGPLGWTSKPEVFTLGTQVLEAALVVRKWGKMGYINANLDVERLCTRLMRADIHPLWLLNIVSE